MNKYKELHNQIQYALQHEYKHYLKKYNKQKYPSLLWSLGRILILHQGNIYYHN